MLLLSHRGQQVQQDRPVLPDLQDLRALTQLLLDQPVQRALQGQQVLQALLDQQDPQVPLALLVQPDQFHLLLWETHLQELALLQIFQSLVYMILLILVLLD